MPLLNHFDYYISKFKHKQKTKPQNLKPLPTEGLNQINWKKKAIPINYCVLFIRVVPKTLMKGQMPQHYKL